jgi:hypothetical protein
MEEFHKRPYVGHLVYQKRVTLVRQLYLLAGNEARHFPIHCKVFRVQQVKVEHQHPIGLLQPLEIIVEMGSDFHGFYHRST